MASRVIVEQRFAEVAPRVEAELLATVDEIDEQAAEAARRLVTVKRTGKLRDGIEAVPAAITPGGIIGGVSSSDYKSNWYEKGTVNPAYKSVRPLHFLAKGLASTRAVERIGAAVRKACEL